MRLLVIFDLPVKTKAQRKAATKFRKFLLNDGYYMVQYSVYVRICNGYDAIKKHETRLQQNAPEYGSIRALTVTENQYEKMKLILGKPFKKDEKQTNIQISFF